MKCALTQWTGFDLQVVRDNTALAIIAIVSVPVLLGCIASAWLSLSTFYVINNLVEAMHLATFIPTTSCILLSAFTTQQAAFTEQSIADATLSGPAILIGIGIFCGIVLLLAFAMVLAAWRERRQLIAGLAVADVILGIISIVLGLVMIAKYSPDEAIHQHCEKIYTVHQTWIRHFAACTKYSSCDDPEYSVWVWEYGANNAKYRCINFRCCGSLQLAVTETTKLMAMLMVGTGVWCFCSALAAMYAWSLLLFRAYDDHQSEANQAKYGACTGNGFKHPYSAATTIAMCVFVVIMLIVVLPTQIKTRPEFTKVTEEALITGLDFAEASNASSTRPLSYSDQYVADAAPAAPACNPPENGSCA